MLVEPKKCTRNVLGAPLWLSKLSLAKYCPTIIFPLGMHFRWEKQWIQWNKAKWDDTGWFSGLGDEGKCSVVQKQ